MQSEGIVVKSSSETAIVKVRKSSSCGHDCGECRLCNNPEIELEVLNPAGAMVGDRVIVGTSSSQVILQAFLLYILPIVGALAVYITASSLDKGNLLTVLAVGVWIVLWFCYMRHYSKHKVSQSCILEVIHEKN